MRFSSRLRTDTYLVMKETPVPPDVSIKTWESRIHIKLVEELLLSTVSLLQHVFMGCSCRMVEVLFCLMRILSLKMDSHKKVRLLQNPTLSTSTTTIPQSFIKSSEVIMTASVRKPYLSTHFMYDQCLTIQITTLPNVLIQSKSYTVGHLLGIQQRKIDNVVSIQDWWLIGFSICFSRFDVSDRNL